MRRVLFLLLIMATAVAALPANLVVAEESTSAKNKVFIPLVMRNYPPDRRFGLAQYTVAEAQILGFPNDGRQISKQSETPDEGSTTFFLRPASITKKRWCLAAYRIAGRPDLCTDPTGETIATADGWYDKAGFRAFIAEHKGRSWIVGNESLCPEPCGDGLTPTEYARWHRAAYTFIKRADPTARVAQWGTIGLGDGNVGGGGTPEEQFLMEFWGEYKRMYGTPLPSDFFPTHHYAWPGWTLEAHTQSLVDWIGWLESRRGVDWVGPRDYWLTEFGLPAWRLPIEESEATRYMNEVIPWLKQNDLGITTWSWWPSCNKGWPDKCVKLLDDAGVPTALGKLYFKLAVTP